LSEGNVRLPKLFRQTVPQRWLGGRKKAVTELVAWSLDQARSIISRPQRTAASRPIRAQTTQLELFEKSNNPKSSSTVLRTALRLITRRMRQHVHREAYSAERVGRYLHRLCAGAS